MLDGGRLHNLRFPSLSTPSPPNLPAPGPSVGPGEPLPHSMGIYLRPSPPRSASTPRFAPGVLWGGRSASAARIERALARPGLPPLFIQPPGLGLGPSGRSRVVLVGRGFVGWCSGAFVVVLGPLVGRSRSACGGALCLLSLFRWSGSSVLVGSLLWGLPVAWFLRSLGRLLALAVALRSVVLRGRTPLVFGPLLAVLRVGSSVFLFCGSLLRLGLVALGPSVLRPWIPFWLLPLSVLRGVSAVVFVVPSFSGGLAVALALLFLPVFPPGLVPLFRPSLRLPFLLVRVWSASFVAALPLLPVPGLPLPLVFLLAFPFWFFPFLALFVCGLVVPPGFLVPSPFVLLSVLRVLAVSFVGLPLLPPVFFPVPGVLGLSARLVLPFLPRLSRSFVFPGPVPSGAGPFLQRGLQRLSPHIYNLHYLSICTRRCIVSALSYDFHVLFDGGSTCNGSPQARAYGSALLVCRDGRKDTERYTFRRGQTNNQAEYGALIMALQSLITRIEAAGQDPGAFTVRVVGDSLLVLHQITGEFKCKAPTLLPLRNAARQLVKRFDAVTLEHTPRETCLHLLGH